MPGRSSLDRQLLQLETVLEALERMNLRRETELPTGVIRLLHDLGIVDQDRQSPTELIPKIMDQQRLLRRRLASLKRQGSG